MMGDNHQKASDQHADGQRRSVPIVFAVRPANALPLLPVAEL